jgi:hypothetical protein
MTETRHSWERTGCLLCPNLKLMHWSILVTLLSRSTSNCVLIARPGDHPGRKVYLDHIFD